MPEFTKYITPIGSPLMTHSKMLKETYGNDIAIVFIGPCIAKKNEIDDINTKGMISYNVTFEHLVHFLRENPVNNATPYTEDCNF